MRLCVCMGIWAALVCVWAYWAERIWLLPGFGLGLVGSACYIVHLYRQLKESVELKETIDPVETEASMRSGLAVRIAIVLTLLALSRWVEFISPLAALLGFFSFQISLFGYAAVISVLNIFLRDNLGH